MTYYNKIKQLDLESAAKMTEGSGPADECLCSVLAAPEDQKTGFGAMRHSIKKAFRTVSQVGNRKKKVITGDGSGVIIPLTTQKGGTGIYTTKETVKRKSACGKCGCDKQNLVLKHSFANIKIISPDVSSVCPCPNDCFPKDKLSNIKVTVEHVSLHPDDADSEASVAAAPAPRAEPRMERRAIADLIEAQYYGSDTENLEDTTSDWSFDIEEKR